MSGLMRVWLAAIVLFAGSADAQESGAQNAFSPLATARPNLIPMNVSLGSYSARPGELITVAWTMTNSGSGNCPASFTGLRLGTSANTPPSNPPLYVTYTTPEIPARSSIRQTNSITIPSNLPFGTYYLWVIADDVQNSTLNQTSRADDVTRSAALAVVSVRRQPNLIPQNVVLSAARARPGGPVTVIWTLTNSGNVMCPASLTGLRLGASATTPPTGDLLQVPTPEIPANSAIRFTNVVTIPPGTAFGTYYLWVVADNVQNSSLNQTSRADDTARSVALAVVAVVEQPNLIPQNVTLSSQILRRGDQLTVVWTMTNAGNGNAPASVTGLHLGTSATTPPATDPLDITVPTPGINAGTSIRQTNVIAIPLNAPLGTNYIWVIADDVANSTLDQSSRADDAARSAPLAIVTVIPQPNLVPGNVALSTEFVRPGDSLTVRWAMTNSGTANAPASKTGLRLGQSATVPPTSGFAVLVDTPAINTNSVVNQTNALTIPANTAFGTYYVWVVADDVPDSTLDQSSRADDAARSGPLAVVAVLPQPNLIPLNVSLSAFELRPGQQVSVSWTMTNSGNANAAASTTGLHLGTSPTTPPTNDVLNLKVATPQINAGTAIRQTNVVTVPAGTATGTYYLWVVADDVANSTLNQSSRADDAARSSALLIARATLVEPAPGERVSAPPTFRWSAPGTAGTTVYVANKPSPVLGTDAMAFFINTSGTTNLQASQANWVAVVSSLGAAENYYWTVGSSDPQRREIYAPWQPFRTLPLLTAPTFLPGANARFRFQVVAPNHPQLEIQAADNLASNWIDLGTIQNVAGIVSYTNDVAGGASKRFFRAKTQ